MRMFWIVMPVASVFVTVAIAEPLKPGFPARVRAARSTASGTAIIFRVGVLRFIGKSVLVSGNSSPLEPPSIKGQGVSVTAIVNTVVSTSTATSS